MSESFLRLVLLSHCVTLQHLKLMLRNFLFNNFKWQLQNAATQQVTEAEHQLWVSACFHRWLAITIFISESSRQHYASCRGTKRPDNRCLNCWCIRQKHCEIMLWGERSLKSWRHTLCNTKESSNDKEEQLPHVHLHRHRLKYFQQDILLHNNSLNYSI